MCWHLLITQTIARRPIAIEISSQIASIPSARSPNHSGLNISPMSPRTTDYPATTIELLSIANIAATVSGDDLSVIR
jgi:hypothetical protein